MVTFKIPFEAERDAVWRVLVGNDPDRQMFSSRLSAIRFAMRRAASLARINHEEAHVVIEGADGRLASLRHNNDIHRLTTESPDVLEKRGSAAFSTGDGQENRSDAPGSDRTGRLTKPNRAASFFNFFLELLRLLPAGSTAASHFILWSQPASGGAIIAYKPSDSQPNQESHP